MGILDRINDRIHEKIKNPTLAALVKDQNLKDLLVRREFRITQEYLQREFFDPAVDEEILELSIRLLDGYGEICGKMKKRLLPFAIPFSATFTVQSVEFSGTRKSVLLKLEKVEPIDLEWLNKKILGRVPFLSCIGSDLIHCDLNKVPRLAELFAYRVKGINPWDYITLKELSLKEGEVAGRVGVVL
jgi:hypothetical protein